MKAAGKRRIPWLDWKANDVNVMNRAYAYMIDWAIGGIVTGFPGVLLYAAVTGRSDMYTEIYAFPSLGYSSGWAYLSCLLSMAAYLIYFVAVPLRVWPGQTLGKKWMKLQIVRTDGSLPDLKSLLMRQVVGLVLLEGSATIMTRYLRQAATLASRFYLDGPVLVIGYVITMSSILLALSTPSHRAVHDYISDTRVISLKQN